MRRCFGTEDVKSAPILPKKRSFFRPLFLACAAVPLVCSQAAEKPDDPMTALAAQIADATTPEAQQQLIDSASQDLRGKPVRDALMDREYRLMLEGDYGKAEGLCRLIAR